ncbi:transporter substrate-binding domain-containing protein [uncultured Roseobacter sp.]|uniref:transporter substrate-binding domain-containing protein n=1 Tax=uncultured Roseobacter sp. TaxID=114847 RepID=UPI002624B150|nr:transporter substrate-binding domain-containing protein [uncultured Roseobacter sp.]
MCLFRPSAVYALALAGLLCFQPDPTSAADLTIGVRADAPPFSYLTVPRSEGRDTEDAPSDVPGKVFTGYIVNICTEVIAEMQKTRHFTVRFEELEAKNRFTALQSGDIDVLCDPATIDQSRLRAPTVMVSSPVFLSGVGVAQSNLRQWAGHWPCIGPVVGIVEGTTARRAVQLIAEEFGFGETFSRVVRAHPDPEKVTLSQDDANSLDRCASAAQNFGIDPVRLASYTASGRTTDEISSAVAVREYANHRALARALCQNEVYYSVGDLEIVARALDAVIAEEMPDCDVRINPQVFSEERYGIFVHISDVMDHTDRLALAFLRQLSIEINKGHNSILVRSFADNFDRTKISRSLDLFFWSVVAGAH